MLPDDLKSVLYDLLLVVTKDDIGKAICAALISDKKDPQKDSGLRPSLAALMQTQPEVAHSFLDAGGLGVNSILLSHTYSVQRAAITLAKNANEQSRVVRVEETVERRLGEMGSLPLAA